MVTWFFVFLGGGLGSVLRFGLSSVLQPTDRGLPMATLSVNLIGCFLLGFFLFSDWGLARMDASRTGIATGGLGGFTTFSTFGVESIRLYEAGQMSTACVYIALSLVGGLAAAYLGIRLATSTL